MAYLIYGACQLTHLNMKQSIEFRVVEVPIVAACAGVLKKYFKSVQRDNDPRHSLFGERRHQEYLGSFL